MLGVIVVAICGLAAGLYYTERYQIRTGSMTPTLEVGETVWAVQMTRAPQRGDIVAFPNPADPTGSEILIKRVIGLPGEIVESRDGVVHIDLGQLDESVLYDDPEFTADFAPIEVAADEVFVMGDNRDESTDSRSFGPVPIDAIGYRIIGQG